MENFDNIRCFRDDEVKYVLERLLDNYDFIKNIAKYKLPYVPGILRDFLLKKKLECIFSDVKNVDDFQIKIIKPIVEKILRESVDTLTYSGMENLSKKNGKGFLLISNHRDIVLDPALIDYTLVLAKQNTAEIAIGSNLLGIDWVKDLVRLNKSFIVKRDLPRREQLLESKILSAYIGAEIENGKTIWIAQREGRAKDGNDFTNPAILNMLHLSKRKETSFSDYMNNLNIVPVSISYEYLPCDSMMAKERLSKENSNGSYRKEIGQDEKSMINGITGYKGNIHINFGKTVKGDFKDPDELSGLIDKNIFLGYKVWETNAIALNLLNEIKENGLISDYEKYVATRHSKDFIDRIKSIRGKNQNEMQKLQQYVLEMYANPLTNKKKYLR